MTRHELTFHVAGANRAQTCNHRAPEGMLRARGAFEVGRSRLAIDVVVSLGVASVAIDRTRLSYDTRHVARSASVLRDGLVVYVVLEGKLHWGDGRVFEGPLAFALPSADFEGDPASSIRYRLEGEHVRALELWLEAHPPSHRAPERLQGELLAASEALFASAAPGEAPVVDDAPRLRATNALLGALADGAWCDRRALLVLEGPAWERLRGVLRDLDLRRSLKVLADDASVSERQFQRDFAALIDVAGTGFRETLRRWRLRLGLLLLSAPDATVAEVARALGYARPEAMNTIFRNAGLPPPSTLRAMLRKGRVSDSRSLAGQSSD
jgi:AraC-like DNA-binding protein